MQHTCVNTVVGDIINGRGLRNEPVAAKEELYFLFIIHSKRHLTSCTLLHYKQDKALQSSCYAGNKVRTGL